MHNFSKVGETSVQDVMKLNTMSKHLRSFPTQSRCRQGSVVTMLPNWNVKLNIKINICLDFEQIIQNWVEYAYLLSKCCKNFNLVQIGKVIAF